MGEQVFVFLDDLVDQRAVRGGHRCEIGIAAVVFEHFDDIGRTVGLAEALPLAQQLLDGQVRGRIVVDVNQ